MKQFTKKFQNWTYHPNTDVIKYKITHHVSRIPLGMEKLFHIIDKTVLHVITQCDFLSWVLLNLIYLTI